MTQMTQIVTDFFLFSFFFASSQQKSSRTLAVKKNYKSKASCSGNSLKLIRWYFVVPYFRIASRCSWVG